MNLNKLIVYLNEERVGELVLDSETDDLSSIYYDSWSGSGFEISPSLPFGEKIKSTSVRRFLENLFPEGNALEDLKEQFRIGVSNTFAIIRIIGKDTTGALSFLPEDVPVNGESSFREGVQDKLPITMLSDGRMGFGEGAIASTHILKFQKDDTKTPCLVLNEFFCMSLAKSVGIEVPEVSYRPFGGNPALLVKRFDRHIESDTKVSRRHIIDSCQELNLLSSYRYERNFGQDKDVSSIREGVSFKKLFNLTMRCDVLAVNQLELINWMLFNLLIGNSDAHGKNISFFIDEKGMRIAPFYDLVNTIYPDLAMSIGDEFIPSQIYAFQLAEFCNENYIQKELLANQFNKICAKVELGLEKISLYEVCEGNPKTVGCLGKTRIIGS